jgi:hypothetical protein
VATDRNGHTAATGDVYLVAGKLRRIEGSTDLLLVLGSNGDVALRVAPGDVCLVDDALAGGGSGAPVGAQYIVAAADGTLTAERVATATATIGVDFATAAQAKFNVNATSLDASHMVPTTFLDNDTLLSANSATRVATQHATLTALLTILTQSQLYADSLLQALPWKSRCDCATTGNVNLSSTTAVDGVTLTTGMRVLVWQQSTGSQNGIYSYAGGGVLTRALDCDAGLEFLSQFVHVTGGSTHAGKLFQQTLQPFVFGSDTATYVQVLPLIAGTGIGVSGATISVANNGVGDAQLRQGGACSVIGRSANSTGNEADISAGSNGTVLKRASNALSFAAVDLAADVTGDLPFSNLVQSASPGVSVVGKSGSGVGDFAEIAASTNGTVLKRSAGSLSFAAVDLAADVGSSVLPIANGGTNSTTAANARTALGLSIDTDVQRPSLVGTQITTQGGDTFTNSAVTNSFATTKAIAAGYANATGAVLRVTAAGTMVTQGTSTTQVFNLLFGSTVMAATGAMTVGKSLTLQWRLVVECVVRTAGGSGALRCQGTCWMGNGSGVAGTTGVIGTMGNTADVSPIDLTAGITVGISEKMGAAVASWSVTQDTLIVEVLRLPP